LIFLLSIVTPVWVIVGELISFDLALYIDCDELLGLEFNTLRTTDSFDR